MPAPAASDASSEGAPAVLVVGFIPGIDGANLYAAALPELPTGDVEYSQYRELSATEAYMYASHGYVFFWNGEDRTMTRFSVSENYDLVDGPTISFANQIPGSSHHTFISPTRAYSLSSDLDEVLVWNPEAMEITGSIPMALPERPAEMVSFPYYSPAVVVGDRVIWDIVSVDETNNIPHPNTTLAIASASSDEPVRFIEDDRCVGGGGGYADAEGNYYVRAGALAWDPARELPPLDISTRRTRPRSSARSSSTSKRKPPPRIPISWAARSSAATSTRSTT